MQKMFQIFCLETVAGTACDAAAGWLRPMAERLRLMTARLCCYFTVANFLLCNCWLPQASQHCALAISLCMYSRFDFAVSGLYTL